MTATEHPAVVEQRHWSWHVHLGDTCIPFVTQASAEAAASRIDRGENAVDHWATITLTECAEWGA